MDAPVKDLACQAVMNNPELIALIAAQLDPKDIIRCSRVSKAFLSACDSCIPWHRFTASPPPKGLDRKQWALIQLHYAEKVRREWIQRWDRPNLLRKSIDANYHYLFSPHVTRRAVLQKVGCIGGGGYWVQVPAQARAGLSVLPLEVSLEVPVEHVSALEVVRLLEAPVEQKLGV